MPPSSVTGRRPGEELPRPHPTPSGSGGPGRRAPLSDLMVVSLEHAIAAPLASRYLADMGARVIKIERPGVGDMARGYDTAVKGMSSHFVWTNRSKESAALDLRSAQGKAILDQLLGRADIFITNLSQGAVEKLGLDGAELTQHHKRLIVCRITGFSPKSGLSSLKAYDLLIQAESGLLSITGTPDEMAKVGIPVADIAAGTFALIGILSRIHTRDQTGRGGIVRVSLWDSLIEWMGYPILYTKYGGNPPERTGPRHATISPYGPIRLLDGIVFIAVQNAPEWGQFCKTVLQRPELAEDPRFHNNTARVRNRDRLETEIQKVTAGLTVKEVEERLVLADIAHGRCRSIDDLLDHPTLLSDDRWVEVDSPVGTIETLAPPLDFGALSGAPKIPALGEDTSNVLRWIGYSDQEIQAFQASGIVGT